MASDILTDQIETFNNNIIRTEPSDVDDTTGALFASDSAPIYNTRCCTQLAETCPLRMLYLPVIGREQNARHRGAICKDVVVIGNGPSGITLSYILSGNRPFVKCDSLKKHSNTFLQYRFEALRRPGDDYVSLLEQDLEELAHGLEGRSKNPVSLLYDTLAQPDADIGGLNSDLLSWRYSADCVDHVVLGKTEVGGAWQSMDRVQMKTVSIGRWMDLPDYSFQQWFQTHRHLVEDTASLRVSMSDVRDYYYDYVYNSKLSAFSRNFRIRTEVTCVQPLSTCDEYNWKVCGVETTKTGDLVPFCYHCKSVVVATGVFDQSNQLNVVGENLNYVHHSLKEIDDVMSSADLDRSLPLLVIGGGLSAADAILLAARYRLRLVHVIRGPARDSSLKHLPSHEYPEYSHVYDLITTSSTDADSCYTCYSEHRVVKFLQGNLVVIESLEAAGEEDKVLKVCAALVLIGYSPKLGFLPSEVIEDDDKRIAINAGTYESRSSEDLFAMGSLVGDNFVRFACGGALAIAASITKRYTRTPTPAPVDTV